MISSAPHCLKPRQMFSTALSFKTIDYLARKTANSRSHKVLYYDSVNPTIIHSTAQLNITRRDKAPPCLTPRLMISTAPPCLTPRLMFSTAPPCLKPV